jgi:hypothetical protein
MANEGVPQDTKMLEEQRQDSYILQAKVLQLRNELYRQRRIRSFNQRTFQATKDRSHRVESLVAEMRTDLKSLKNRLDEELNELGIDIEKSEEILKDYYTSQDYDDEEVDEEEEEEDEASPSQKRSRGSYDEDDDDMKSTDDHHPSEGAGGDHTSDEEAQRQVKRPRIASQ